MGKHTNKTSTEKSHICSWTFDTWLFSHLVLQTWDFHIKVICGLASTFWTIIEWSGNINWCKINQLYRRVFLYRISETPAIFIYLSWETISDFTSVSLYHAFGGTRLVQEIFEFLVCQFPSTMFLFHFNIETKFTFDGLFFFVDRFHICNAVPFVGLKETGCGRREGVRSRAAIISAECQRFNQQFRGVQQIFIRNLSTTKLPINKSPVNEY